MKPIKITHVASTREARWKTARVTPSAAREFNLQPSGTRHQTFEGFGGCFNELGWIALGKLPAAARTRVMDALFSPEGECRFNFCRLPVGASDYGAEWYSLNEHDGDFAMRRFSVARDERFLIPYIREALRRRPDLRLFASPWSPPTWMKFPKAYNYGTLIWKPAYLKAYALYLARFVEEYARRGIRIGQVHVQNEPVADQKFPSCLWTGPQMGEFIRDYLAPLFRRRGVPAEIWLGTLNTDDYNGFVHAVLSDPRTRAAVAGVGFQWAGKGAIARTAESWPDMRLMQTENECGDGRNTWEYAMYIHELFRHYLTHGAHAYIYWNMVLEPTGRSTWGWQQNSLVVVDPERRTASFTPEYDVMRHHSRFIAPGAVRLGLSGSWTSNATAFQNRDGSVVVNLCNPHAREQELVYRAGDGLAARVRMAPESFNTLVLA